MAWLAVPKHNRRGVAIGLAYSLGTVLLAVGLVVVAAYLPLAWASEVAFPFGLWIPVIGVHCERLWQIARATRGTAWQYAAQDIRRRLIKFSTVGFGVGAAVSLFVGLMLPTIAPWEFLVTLAWIGGLGCTAGLAAGMRVACGMILNQLPQTAVSNFTTAETTSPPHPAE